MQLTVAPQVLGVTSILVTNNTELATALSTVKGGETIQLAPGNYGSISITGGAYSQMSIGGVKTGTKSPVLTSPVKITSQDSNNRAVVDRIETRSTDNWVFDSLIIKPAVPGVLTTFAVMISGNNNMMQNCYVTYSFENSDSWDAAKWAATVGSGISVNAGSNNVIQNNYVSNVYMGISVGAPNTKVLSNVVNYFSGDGMRGVADNGLFEGNIIKNIRIINSNHPDGFQSWSLSPTGTPGGGVVTGTIVRGNVFLISENLSHPLATGMQGIGMFDGNYQDWVIEDNVIMTEAYHGIAVYGAINVKVDHNTVINIRKNPTYKTWITIAAHKGATTSAGVNTVTNNLSSLLSLVPGATQYNATTSVSIQTATSFSGNNFVVPVANYGTVYSDLSTFNARLQSPSTYNNAGSRIFIDPRATTAPTIPTTPVTPPVVTTPAPTLTLGSQPATIVAGGTATLTWSSTDATACTASGDWTGVKSVNGSVATGALTVGTKTFTLMCTGTGGSVTKSVSVTVTTVMVPPTVPTATLTAPVTTALTGSATTLTWGSTNATACTASGDWTGSKSTSGSEAVTFATVGTKTFTLMCTGTGGSVTKTLSIVVTAPIVTVPVPTASTTFKIGDRVTMIKNVNVRTTGLLSTATLIGVNASGSQGVLIAGPTVTSDRYGVITWFNVNFDSGFDGWVGADNYKLVTTVPPVVNPRQAQIDQIRSMIALLQQMLAQLLAQ